MVKILLQCFIAISIAGVSVPSFARDPEIRLYKMTRDGHSEKYMLFGKADNAGCNNTPYTYHVYKIAVLAFKSCSAFSAKDCQPDSILPVYWKQKKKSSTTMKQGTRWFMAPDASEVPVLSWSCELK